MRKMFGASAVLPLMAASLAAAQVGPATKARQVDAVDAADLHRARRVLRSFFATGVRRECYRISFSRRGPHLAVTFSSRRPLIRYKGEPVDTAAEACPPSAGFLIDRRGRVVSRFRPR